MSKPYNQNLATIRRLRTLGIFKNKLPSKETVLQCLADGWSIEDIADEFDIRTKTVGEIKNHCIKKLRAKSLPHAIAIGMRTGLLK